MFIEHLQSSYFNRKHAWAISVRNDEKLPTHSTNTSNYIEASFRITKDRQFNRTKAFNLVELLDIVLDDSVYYRKRLLDIGNNRLGAFKNTKSRYNIKNTCKITEDDIIDVGEHKFIVQSEKNKEIFYNVDMVSGFCDCKAGRNCGPCKHKGAISKFKKISEFSILPESDVKSRALYHYIAEGKVCNDTWYRDLDDPNHVTDVSVFVEERSNIPGPSTQAIQIENEASSDIVHESDESNTEVSEDDDDREEILGQFREAMDTLKDKITNIYENKLKKGVKYFTKKLQRMAKQTNTSMEKSLFDIGKEVKNSKKTGRKKRIGKLIPVQVTAKNRREYKHRGRVLGVAGRRHKDQESKK